jgi:hypothetical protein
MSYNCLSFCLHNRNFESLNFVLLACLFLKSLIDSIFFIDKNTNSIIHNISAGAIFHLFFVNTRRLMSKLQTCFNVESFLNIIKYHIVKKGNFYQIL